MTPKQPRYAREVRELLANLDSGQDKEDQEPETQIPGSPRQEPEREVHFIFIREQEEEDEGDVVDSVAMVHDLDTAPLQPAQAQQPTALRATGILPFSVFLTLLCLFCIAVQVDFIVNPFAVTVSLQARSQQLTVQGTLQLGRELNPITVSQSATVPATGRGHQDARNATGYITFYNGQLQSITVSAGTMLTGSGGVQIVTDADATIPAADLTANPPVIGQATVPAQAVSKGRKGNIAAYDINEPCCSSVVAKNLNSFSGGQDERDFQTVTKSDIANAATPLKATINQSVQGALEGQLKNNEALVTPSCATSTTSDHQPGEEATQVKVTASETCTAVAYNDQELTEKVTQRVRDQAGKKFGAGYDLRDAPQITITAATPGKQVTLSFTSVSTWVYGISSEQQRRIKAMIAGKNTQSALQLLSSMPGIESASLQFSGFGNASRIPKNIGNVHLMIYTSA